MAELWDIYDKNRNKTGRFAVRDVDALKEGEYHIIVNAVIINSEKKILIARRAPHKKNPLFWECSGGSILAGESSLDGMLREVKEELGLVFNEKDAVLLKEVRRDRLPPDFKDLWLFYKDVSLKDVTFPDGEAIDAKWVSIDEFMKMYEDEEIIKSVDFGIDDYKKAMKLIDENYTRK